MPSHTPGKRLTEGRVVDRQSVERAGCSVPNDTDQPPVYGSEEMLFPEGWDDMDPGRFG